MHGVRFVAVSKGKKARVRRAWSVGHDNFEVGGTTSITYLVYFIQI